MAERSIYTCDSELPPIVTETRAYQLRNLYLQAEADLKEEKLKTEKWQKLHREADAKLEKEKLETQKWSLRQNNTILKLIKAISERKIAISQSDESQRLARDQHEELLKNKAELKKRDKQTNEAARELEKQNKLLKDKDESLETLRKSYSQQVGTLWATKLESNVERRKSKEALEKLKTASETIERNKTALKELTKDRDELLSQIKSLRQSSLKQSEELKTARRDSANDKKRSNAVAQELRVLLDRLSKAGIQVDELYEISQRQSEYNNLAAEDRMDLDP